jgi:hypothetical protein
VSSLRVLLPSREAEALTPLLAEAEALAARAGQALRGNVGGQRRRPSVEELGALLAELAELPVRASGLAGSE